MKQILIYSIIIVFFGYNIYLYLNISNKVFSIILFIIYIVNYILYYRKTKVEFISPTNIILFTFPLITFLYYPFLEDTIISNLFIYQTVSNISYSTIIYCQVVSLISFLFFMLGNSLKGVLLFRKRNVKMFRGRRKFLHIVNTVVILLAITKGLLNLVSRYENDSKVGLTEAEMFLSIITVLLTISSVLEFRKLSTENITNTKNILKKINLLYVVNVLFICSLYLISGFRSGIFPIVFPIIYLISRYIYMIKTKFLLLGIILGVFFMSFIRDTRGGRIAENHEFSLLSLFGDFTAANTGLFYLIDNTMKFGSQWGSNIIYQVVAFFPFSQYFIKNIFLVDTTKSSSEYYMDNTNWEYGLGTNVVGDLYYTFDIFGPPIILFLFGYFIKCVKVSSKNSVLAEIFYMLILGSSLMFCRIEFFSIIRYFGLAFFTYLLLKTFIKE